MMTSSLKNESYSLFTRDGTRKYLTQSERNDFIQAANAAEDEIKLLCLILAYTGCRLSEAVALTPKFVDLGNCALTFETLKQRTKGVFRQVPISPELLYLITEQVHSKPFNTGSLFPIHRQTAYRWVGQIMKDAGIKGSHANSRGLRHGFAVASIEVGIPVTLVQKWLGHANLSTTAIYTNVLGEQERNFAKLLWAKAS